MEQRAISCCFTGHRPTKLPWGGRETDPRCTALKYEIALRLEKIYEVGYKRFICGMAMGCDSFFAEAVLALRDIHSDVTLEAAIPCGAQSEKWRKAQREKYNGLIDRCDSVKVLQYQYTPDCMMRRNKYMVDQSSLLLACFNGKPGGTMNTILYAQRQKIQVVIIDI